MGEWFEVFYKSMVEVGWLGIVMFESVGGVGLGIIEVVVMVQVVVESGGGMVVVLIIYGLVFGLELVICFGIEEQQCCMILLIFLGVEKMCFVVIEFNIGFDIISFKICVEKVDGGYCVNGEKVWIINVYVVDYMLLIVCIILLEVVMKKIDGLMLFYIRFDCVKIEYWLIFKMGCYVVGLNMLFILDLFVLDEDCIGVEGQGFKILFQGFNFECVLFGVEVIGLG